jgi:hypothetical protein
MRFSAAAQTDQHTSGVVDPTPARRALMKFALRRCGLR